MSGLHNLKQIVTKRKKIVGRGYGSGKGGHTSGRGSNGQNARAGGKLRPTFEGGQNELVHRLPVLRGRKRSRGQDASIVITLDMLSKFDDNTVVTYDLLVSKGMIKTGERVKVLNKGTLTKKITLEGIPASSSVKTVIETYK